MLGYKVQRKVKSELGKFHDAAVDVFDDGVTAPDLLFCSKILSGGKGKLFWRRFQMKEAAF